MARSITSQHMKNSLAYVVKNEKDHQFLSADGVDCSSQKNMLDDFKLYSKERVKNEFITAVISPSPNDKLDKDSMEELLQTVLKELNLDNRQYYSVIHQNTENPHIHVILNRIDYDGQTWNDHHVAWKCQKACIDVCTKLDLTNAYESESLKNNKAKKNEFDQSRQEIAKEINSHFLEIKAYANSLQQIHAYLKIRGVKIEIQKFDNGMYGCSFNYKGINIKASKVNRLLSLKANGETFAPNPKLLEIINENIRRYENPKTNNELFDELRKSPERRGAILEDMLHNLSIAIGPNQVKDEDIEENSKRKISYNTRRRAPLGQKNIR